MTDFQRSSPTHKGHNDKQERQTSMNEQLINLATHLKSVTDEVVLKQPQMPESMTNVFIGKIIEKTIATLGTSRCLRVGHVEQPIRLDVEFTEEMDKWVTIQRSNSFRDTSHLTMVRNQEQVEYLLYMKSVLDFLKVYYQTNEVTIYSKQEMRESNWLAPMNTGISITIDPYKVNEGIEKYLYCLTNDKKDMEALDKLNKAFNTIDQVHQQLNTLDNKLGESLGLFLEHLNAIKTSLTDRTKSAPRKPKSSTEHNGG